MAKNTTKSVDINSLSPERQKKVRKIRARIKKGSFIICSRIVDSKTVNRLFRKIASPSTAEESSMSDTMMKYKLNELVNEFFIADKLKQRKSAVIARRVRTKQQIIKKNIESVQELLDHLRVCIKYQAFDLEATRRENAYLKKLLES